jgi:hypothetical protein
MRMRREVRGWLDPEGYAGRNLLKVPPYVYGKTEDRGYRRQSRAFQKKTWPGEVGVGHRADRVEEKLRKAVLLNRGARLGLLERGKRPVFVVNNMGPVFFRSGVESVFRKKQHKAGVFDEGHKAGAS